MCTLGNGNESSVKLVCITSWKHHQKHIQGEYSILFCSTQTAELQVLNWSVGRVGVMSCIDHWGNMQKRKHGWTEGHEVDYSTPGKRGWFTNLR